jgi:CheY-like chemotaxis protein
LTKTPSVSSQPDGRFHVLIADDNAINRRILIAFMKRWDYSFDEAEDGQAALDIYSSSPTSFNLVLMGKHFPYYFLRSVH